MCLSDVKLNKLIVGALSNDITTILRPVNKTVFSHKNYKKINLNKTLQNKAENTSKHFLAASLRHY